MSNNYKTILNNFSIFLLKNIPISFFEIKKNEIILYLSPKNLYPILLFLKKNTQCQFKILSDITAIDFNKHKNRFYIIYNLLSIQYATRIRLKIYTNELIHLYSITKIFKAANWFEREIFDLFGIFFKNNSDLRRILTDYGFEGFPLRKDFPLSGYLEVFYNEKQQKILYKKTQLLQNFRNYDIQQYWQI